MESQDLKDDDVSPKWPNGNVWEGRKSIR